MESEAEHASFPAKCMGIFDDEAFNTHANSPGLSGSLPDTEQISRSPVRVTKPPG